MIDTEKQASGKVSEIGRQINIGPYLYLSTYRHRLPWWLCGKEYACSTADAGSILGQKDPMEKEMATQLSILPGEFHGQRSLEGYSQSDHRVLDTTE